MILLNLIRRCRWRLEHLERRLAPPASTSPCPTTGWVEHECLGCRWKLNLQSCIARDLVTRGIWEPVTTQLIQDMVKPGMQVLDIGANFGYYTVLMARQVGTTGRVWAFEPVQRYREQLLWHLQQNQLADRVQVVSYALSDMNDTATIQVDDSSATLSAIAKVPGRAIEPITLRRLDDVRSELGISRVDFIKSDVEGHEPALLRGAWLLLQEFHPPLAMEFAQHCLHLAQSDVREQVRLLQELGYMICSETTRQPYESEMSFLMECGNFDHSGNALALPNSNFMDNNQRNWWHHPRP